MSEQDPGNELGPPVAGFSLFVEDVDDGDERAPTGQELTDDEVTAALSGRADPDHGPDDEVG